jgi:hypothetical protein
VTTKGTPKRKQFGTTNTSIPKQTKARTSLYMERVKAVMIEFHLEDYYNIIGFGFSEKIKNKSVYLILIETILLQK